MNWTEIPGNFSYNTYHFVFITKNNITHNFSVHKSRNTVFTTRSHDKIEDSRESKCVCMCLWKRINIKLPKKVQLLSWRLSISSDFSKSIFKTKYVYENRDLYICACIHQIRNNDIFVLNTIFLLMS